MWKTLRRWRTWIFNTVMAVVFVLPDILAALAGFDWSGIIPPRYMPYVTLAIILLNIWMRPRAAVLPTDDEARR